MRASDPHIGSLKWQDPSPIGPGVVVSAFVHAGIIALALSCGRTHRRLHQKM
jgi:hypothetical protein